MTFEEMQDIIAAVTYKPHWFVRLYPGDERPYIQIEVDDMADAARCSVTGAIATWKGGKRYLSFHMCRQEIVGACLAAIKDAEMHECHEWFRYRGVSIYNPHLDPDVLALVAHVRKNFNVRKNAMTMEEDDG